MTRSKLKNYLLTAALLVAGTAAAEPAKGTRLLPFSGMSPNGSPVSVQPKAGHPTLLVFYFAGCGACIEELPLVHRFMKRHPNVRVVGVTFDSPKEAAEFIRQRKVSFPVVAGAQRFIDKAGVTTYPYIALLSASGGFVSSVQGAIGTETATKRKVDLLEPWFRRVSPET